MNEASDRPDPHPARVSDLVVLVEALERTARHAGAQAESFRQQLAVAERAAADHASRAATLQNALNRAVHEAEAEQTRQAVANEADLAAFRERLAALEIELSAAKARIALVSSHRAVALAAAHRSAARTLATESLGQERIAALQSRIDDLERQAEILRQNAADWRQRYEGLRERLARILHRFWITRAAKLVPQPVRRFARARLLRWDRS